ncbi:phytoene/squalene synthase family protein [Bradyrhizobium sp. STM 3809]|uniref:phytoene/squalene synthase family protein n=1 Tax=Bradyrhizobium sp. STM 3809 TaxID=551936 RepID=UPI000240990A|nr:phytoene/squalene synthase family protein [Bradyrhizobium sp. STM 3809]CCE02280.1 Phytoene synthase [Bradyrhizobium sp. STM 3809]
MTLRDGDLERLSESVIRTGSKSFAAASKLFDARTRASVHLLYAWCRHCDDVIDGQDLGIRSDGSAPSAPAGTLQMLRDRTTQALEGAPMREPVFQGLQRVVQEHAIPHHHVFELLDGFAMDVDGREYESLSDTLDYCYHVAGVVGVMMSAIMGAREDATLDRAADLGIALQLTNIARDVIEDAQAGRIYLPRQWLREAGVPVADVAAPQHRQAVFRVVARLLDVAEQFYEASEAGIARLPVRCAWAVETARVVYRQIGREVMKRGPGAWEERIATSSAQKLGAIGRSALTLGITRTWGKVPAREHNLWTRPKARGADDARASFANACSNRQGY